MGSEIIADAILRSTWLIISKPILIFCKTLLFIKSSPCEKISNKSTKNDYITNELYCKPFFKIKKQNAVLWGSAALATLLTAAVIYIPFMAKMFEFTPVSAKEYFIAIAIAFSIIPIVELVKLIERFINKKKAMKK